MRRILVIIVGCFMLMSFQQQRVVEYGKLYYKDGLMYEENSYTPFTGITVAYFSNGVLESEVTWYEGRTEGLVKEYYDNGNPKIYFLY